MCISSALLALSGLIYSISSGKNLPEELAQDTDLLSAAPAGNIRAKLLIEKALSIYSVDQLFQYAVRGSGYEAGYILANLEGVLYVMKKLLGPDIKAISDVVSDTFKKIDVVDAGEINVKQFDELLSALKAGDEASPNEEEIKERQAHLSSTRGMFDTKVRSTLMASTFGPGGINAAAKRYLMGEGKFGAKNWSMLYCGGAQPVLDQLKAYKKEFGIGLAVEKFDW